MRFGLVNKENPAMIVKFIIIHKVMSKGQNIEDMSDYITLDTDSDRDMRKIEMYRSGYYISDKGKRVKLPFKVIEVK